MEVLLFQITVENHARFFQFFVFISHFGATFQMRPQSKFDDDKFPIKVASHQYISFVFISEPRGCGLNWANVAQNQNIIDDSPDEDEHTV